MYTPPLPLSNVVQIAVNLGAPAQPIPEFNTGLILGTSTRIPSWGGGGYRVRAYSSLAGMLSDGFATTDPEYIAASLYFSPQLPPQLLLVGRVDNSGSSIATIVVHSGSGGTGYVAGDIVSVNGGTSGLAKVTTVSGGVVTGIVLLQDGTGYSGGSSVATVAVTGSGGGLTVDITVASETPVQALNYVLQVNTGFWGVYYCGVAGGGPADADISNLASSIESMGSVNPMYQFANTADSSVLNNQSNNVAAVLKALLYKRTWLQYATTQGGVYPNNVYAGASVMGTAMGLNTGLANSYFTMKFKQLIGIAPEPLTQSQVATIEGLNVNVYANYQDNFVFTEQGVSIGGTYFDETLNLDMISAAIQILVTDAFVSYPAIPQTDQGQGILIHAVNQAAQAAVVRGWIAPGRVWEGITILSLTPGQTLPAGYVALSDRYANQNPSDRQARKAMPIYLAVAEAGAVHSLLVGVYVQR